MNESKISVRYAKAIFQIAIEKNQIEQIHKDFKLIFQFAKDEYFNRLITDPVLSAKKRIEIFEKAFEGKISPLSFNFFKLLANKKREAYIERIILNFNGMYAKHTGIKEASITSAVPLGEKVKAQLKEYMENFFNTKLEITDNVDEKLLGGFILRVEDKQLDASISTKLSLVKEKLLETNLN